MGAGKVFAVTTCAWKELSYDLPMSRVRAYMTSDQSLAIGATAVLGIDTETFDQLSEFNTTTHLFCANSEGYYLTHAQCTLRAVGGAVSTFAISVSGEYGVEKIRSRDVHTAESTDRFSREILAIYHLLPRECLSCDISNTSLSGMIIDGGSERTFLCVYRLS